VLENFGSINGSPTQTKFGSVCSKFP